MAVDTRNKRASVIGIGLAAALTLPLSDGTVSQPDRQSVTWAYAGVGATVPWRPVARTGDSFMATLTSSVTFTELTSSFNDQN